MGSVQTGSVRYDLLPFNPDELHPIEGRVSVFKHRGSSIYVFAKEKVSPSFVRRA
jgi:hypothetical protein